jgi:hypothetical protein
LESEDRPTGRVPASPVRSRVDRAGIQEAQVPAPQIRLGC